MTGQLPYANKTEGGVICAVLQKEFPPRPQFDFLFDDKQSSDDLWLLLTRCWDFEPKDRPTARQVKDEVCGSATEPIAFFETHVLQLTGIRHRMKKIRGSL